MPNVVLRPLIRQPDIRKAFNAISRRLKHGTQAYDRILGFPGGNGEATIHWHAGRGFWSQFAPDHLDTRFHCSFGTVDPTQQRMLPITCEMNCPKQGFDRRTGGVFVKDAEGRIYAAHSGKIGGGSTSELLAFLYYARGSAGEVRSMLLLADRLRRFAHLKSEISDLKSLAESISRQLRAWAAQLQETPIKGQRHLTEAVREDTQAQTRRAAFDRMLDDMVRQGRCKRASPRRAQEPGD